jgi:SNF family Na+-dependent transporter
VARLQQTRFHRSIDQASARLERWATNPWRKLSLLLIVFLASFVVGTQVGAITGVANALDPLMALLAVALIELAIRVRPALLARPEAKLRLALLDMVRIGLLYGLLIEGFKML